MARRPEVLLQKVQEFAGARRAPARYPTVSGRGAGRGGTERGEPGQGGTRGGVTTTTTTARIVLKATPLSNQAVALAVFKAAEPASKQGRCACDQ
ncbi:hypothetical protein E2C01_032732 [Portunus trituberculatus]|uniref:Uncharacterized protein n=1 Tax=Portunus trituberculatus TaxID=210409 RepID=A0A5B7F0E2_PORTR|nr:hypothetical protein [Portunus trituberculatus]